MTICKDEEFTRISNAALIKEFNDVMEVERGRDLATIELRWRLIKEEYKELEDELFPTTSKELDIKKVAKELADLLYVVYGCADVLGIDADGVFEQVHASNMSKLGEDGKPIRREDGKVLKGPNYAPPDLSWVT